MTPITSDGLKRLLFDTKKSTEQLAKDKTHLVAAWLKKSGYATWGDFEHAVAALDDSALRLVDDVTRQLIGHKSQDQTLKEYDRIFEKMKGEEWFVFMNHGYCPRLEETEDFPALAEDDDQWRHQIFLYFHLLETAKIYKTAESLSGLCLLDVGCGRGAGASVMRRYYKLGRVVGLDINPKQINFCKSRHKVSGVDFQLGSALSLPFADATFDLVTNVESSHCYEDLLMFFREVRRVLKPGGAILVD